MKKEKTVVEYCCDRCEKVYNRWELFICLVCGGEVCSSCMYGKFVCKKCAELDKVKGIIEWYCRECEELSRKYQSRLRRVNDDSASKYFVMVP